MAPTEEPVALIYPRKLTLAHRVRCAIRLILLKFITQAYLRILRLPGIQNKSWTPTYSKVYPIQPTLTNRVFIPKSYKSGDAPLPLYIDIHGGGFAIASPEIDDHFCAPFAHDNNFIVVSLDYPKAPFHPFPAAIHALRDTVNAVLADEMLPFDKNKVAIGGFSAGGNLSFAVSQYESLQKRIHGVVGFYPAVNFTTPTVVQMASRPKDAGPDPLENSVSMFNWGYLERDVDMRNPLISVAFAPREKLPSKIYVIGCEQDLLCRDAEIMVKRLAGEGGDRIGTDVVWEKNGVKWEKILGEKHGFDVTPAFGATKIRVERRKAEMFASVAEWLRKEVYV